MLHIKPIYPDTFYMSFTSTKAISRRPGDIAFYMVFKTPASLKINDEAFNYPVQTLFCLDTDDQLTCLDHGDALLFGISVRKDYMDELLPYIHQQIPWLRRQSNDDLKELRMVFAALAKSYFQLETKSAYLFISHFYRLIYQLSLYNQLFSEQPSGTETPWDDIKQQRIFTIKTYIQNHYHQPLSLTELADELHLTPQYLSRFFKEQFNTQFIQYLNKVRLQYAVDELLGTQTGITQISFNNGFPNLTAFNKLFKETYGTTPQKYRLQFQSKQSPTKAEDAHLQVRLFSEPEQLAKHHIDQMLKANIPAPSLQSSEKIVAKVHLQEAQPMNTYFMEVINLGFATNILSHSFQYQLTEMKKDLRFRYARFQGIHEAEVIGKVPQTGEYNFQNVNRIIDFLYSLQVLPFIELGQKPRKFNVDRENYVFMTDLPTIITSAEDYEHFLNRFLHHCINRYGLSEVEKWRFEHWLPHGMHLEYTEEAIADFIRYYQVTYRVIKSLLPHAQVGGCGLNLTIHIDVLGNLLNQLALSGIVFDFISVISFHIEIPHFPDIRFPHITANAEYLPDKLAEVKSHLPAAYRSLPLMVAEWNFDYTSRNLLNDSVFKALFIIKNILEMPMPLQSLGYWFFSDITSEFKDTTNILFGGNGLVTIDGIKKPAYHAYQFLNMLGNQMVAKGKGYIITSNARDSYSLLLYNYVHPSDFFCFRHDTEIFHTNVNDIFEEAPSKTFNLTLDGVIPGKYRIKTYSLSKDHGSILDEWVKMGSIQNVSASEINYFQTITIPSQSIYTLQSTGLLTIMDTLPVNAIHLLSIKLEI